MATLSWLRADNLVPVGEGVILRREKNFVLEGDHYKSSDPPEFKVYRRPCPAIETMLGWVDRGGWKFYTARDTKAIKKRPWFTFWSDRHVEIANVGFCHTHRWIFTDGRDWSGTIRLARFAAVKTRAKGGAKGNVGVAQAGGSVEIEGTVNVGIDPEVVIDFLVPWASQNPAGLRIEDVLRMEVEPLFESEEWTSIYEEIRAVAPELALQDRPAGAYAEWSPVEANLEAGDSIEVVATVGVDGDSAFIFPCCFSVHNHEGELLGLSDVMLVSSNDERMLRVDFLDSNGREVLEPPEL